MVAWLAVPTTRERRIDRDSATLATAHDEPILGVIVDAKPLAAIAAGPSETVDNTSDGSSETNGSENDTSSETSGTDSVEDNNANEEDSENDEYVTDEPDAVKLSGDVSEKDENVPASESLPELQSGIPLDSFFFKSCSF